MQLYLSTHIFPQPISLLGGLILLKSIKPRYTSPDSGKNQKSLKT